MYLTFKKWAELTGSRTMSQTEFGREMPNILTRKRAGEGNGYQGVKWNTHGAELYLAVEAEKKAKLEGENRDTK
jgi:hypothetical protein